MSRADFRAAWLKTAAKEAAEKGFVFKPYRSGPEHPRRIPGRGFVRERVTRGYEVYDPLGKYLFSEFKVRNGLVRLGRLGLITPFRPEVENPPGRDPLEEYYWLWRSVTRKGLIPGDRMTAPFLLKAFPGLGEGEEGLHYARQIIRKYLKEGWAEKLDAMDNPKVAGEYHDKSGRPVMWQKDLKVPRRVRTFHVMPDPGTKFETSVVDMHTGEHRWVDTLGVGFTPKDHVKVSLGNPPVKTKTPREGWLSPDGKFHPLIPHETHRLAFKRLVRKGLCRSYHGWPRSDKMAWVRVSIYKTKEGLNTVSYNWPVDSVVTTTQLAFLEDYLLSTSSNTASVWVEGSGVKGTYKEFSVDDFVAAGESFAEFIRNPSEYSKERREHPSFTPAQVRRIVADHKAAHHDNPLTHKEVESSAKLATKIAKQGFMFPPGSVRRVRDVAFAQGMFTEIAEHAQDPEDRHGAALAAAEIHPMTKGSGYDAAQTHSFSTNPGRNALNFFWATENTKLEKTLTIAFNQMPLSTCPAAGICKAFCFGQRGFFKMTDHELRLAYNTLARLDLKVSGPILAPLRAVLAKGFDPKNASHKTTARRAIGAALKGFLYKGKAVDVSRVRLDPKFAGKVISDIEAMLVTGAGAKMFRPRSIRINDVGDFDSQAYVDAWAKVAQHFAGRLHFYAYTKSHHRYDFSGFPKSFVLVKSFGGVDDKHIDTARDYHALVFFGKKTHGFKGLKPVEARAQALKSAKEAMDALNIVRRKKGLPEYAYGSDEDLPSLPGLGKPCPKHIGLMPMTVNTARAVACAASTPEGKEFWMKRTTTNPWDAETNPLSVRRSGSNLAVELDSEAVDTYNTKNRTAYRGPITFVYDRDGSPQNLSELRDRRDMADTTPVALKLMAQTFWQVVEPSVRAAGYKSSHGNPPLTINQIATILLETLVEVPTGAPEGFCYAPFMASGLDPFNKAVEGLIRIGFIKRTPGPRLQATPQGVSFIQAAKREGGLENPSRREMRDRMNKRIEDLAWSYALDQRAEMGDRFATAEEMKHIKDDPWGTQSGIGTRFSERLEKWAKSKGLWTGVRRLETPRWEMKYKNPQERLLTVTGVDGRPFIVRLLTKGMPYGLNDSLVWTYDRPGVEFYDASQDKARFGQFGQFTGGRYYVSTLLRDFEQGLMGTEGLQLHGAVPVWTISASEMYRVKRWLSQELDMKNPPEMSCRPDPKLYRAALERVLSQEHDPSRRDYYKTLIEAMDPRRLSVADREMLIDIITKYDPSPAPYGYRNPPEDPTEGIRREMLASHVPGERADLEERFGQVWDTQQVRDEFDVIGFMAPFVVVKRKADGVKGSLMFQHSPRYYFSFTVDNPMVRRHYRVSASGKRTIVKKHYALPPEGSEQSDEVRRLGRLGIKTLRKMFPSDSLTRPWDEAEENPVVHDFRGGRGMRAARSRDIPVQDSFTVTPDDQLHGTLEIDGFDQHGMAWREMGVKSARVRDGVRTNPPGLLPDACPARDVEAGAPHIYRQGFCSFCGQPAPEVAPGKGWPRYQGARWAGEKGRWVYNPHKNSNAEPAKDKNGANGYIVYWDKTRKSYEVYADTSYGACKKLAAQLGAKKGTVGMDATLVEKGGEQVTTFPNPCPTHHKNWGECPVCGGPGYGPGEICMDCVRARHRAAVTHRCSCGRKRQPKMVDLGFRKYTACERCLGVISQENPRVAPYWWLPKGKTVDVSAHHSEPGKGLSYGPFVGRMAEDARAGGWDVWDVIDEKGETVSVYGFSLTPRRKLDNPLTDREATALLMVGERTEQMATTKRPGSRERVFASGMAAGHGTDVEVLAESPMLRRRGVTLKYRAGYTASAVLRRGKAVRKNPPGATLIGRKCLTIETTKGECKGKMGAVVGLDGGAVLVKGVFTKLPSGRVKAVWYADEAKAKREGMSNPGTPWKHDFSSEDVSISRCRGGILLRGRRPLWGMR